MKIIKRLMPECLGQRDGVGLLCCALCCNWLLSHSEPTNNSSIKEFLTEISAWFTISTVSDCTCANQIFPGCVRVFVAAGLYDKKPAVVMIQRKCHL